MNLVPSDWAVPHLFPSYLWQGKVADGIIVEHHIFQLSISCRVHITLEMGVGYDFSAFVKWV